MIDIKCDKPFLTIHGDSVFRIGNTDREGLFYIRGGNKGTDFIPWSEVERIVKFYQSYVLETTQNSI